jgi:hypothetical protein
MGGLPPDAFDVLARTMARICEDPYNRLFSLAVRDEDPRERMAELRHMGLFRNHACCVCTFGGSGRPGRRGARTAVSGAGERLGGGGGCGRRRPLR